MCSVKSVSRLLMCAVSVQIRLDTSRSSKSAKCMKAEKFCPSPVGSMIVKRTLPAGSEVSSRSMTSCSDRIATSRPSASAKYSSDGHSG